LRRRRRFGKKERDEKALLLCQPHKGGNLEGKIRKGDYRHQHALRVAECQSFQTLTTTITRTCHEFSSRERIIIRKSIVFGDVMPYSLVEVSFGFGRL
jgi:hypothetical protein